ncbi:hypothetical protein QUF72_09795 [Desulfobacterales bacterium HSG2]|nr:hypothetical protein [Desulfobacterales bacterium HSG2]
MTFKQWIPAFAGMTARGKWIPASAGMTARAAVKRPAVIPLSSIQTMDSRVRGNDSKGRQTPRCHSLHSNNGFPCSRK